MKLFRKIKSITNGAKSNDSLKISLTYAAQSNLATLLIQIAKKHPNNTINRNNNRMTL